MKRVVRVFPEKLSDLTLKSHVSHCQRELRLSGSAGRMVPHLHLRHAVAPTKDSFSVGSQHRGQRQSKYQPAESRFRLQAGRGKGLVILDHTTKAKVATYL